ncbi:MAG: MlaD family protein [Candidatus Poribacteria bacterium]
MRSWDIEAKVGIVVVVGLVLLGLLLVSSTNWPWAASGDVLYIRFDAVNDIRRGAGVQLSGVQVGKVTGIELKTDKNKVEIQVRVKDAFQRLRQGMKVQIGTTGFVGETYIELINGPVGNTPLKPTDLPLDGMDPINMGNLLKQTNQILAETAQLTKQVNGLIQSNQTNVNEGIVEIRELISQTSFALENVVRNTEETMKTFNRLALDNDRRFLQTLQRLNRLINQVENDSLVISSYAGDITRTILDLVNRNAGRAERIIVNLQASSSDFRQMTTKLRQDLNTLNSEFSALISQSRDVIDTETPKFDRILDNLADSTEHLDGLQNNLDQLLDKVQHGEGSIAQLLNKPDVLNEVRASLQTADETMTAIKDLSKTLNRKSDGLKLPSLSWDYELRYLSVEESLHNEFAFSVLPLPNQRYRFGLAVRHEDVKFELQYSYDFTNYLRARLGFIRSKAGAGFDIWLLSRRLGISVEGTHLTSKDPELNTELTWRLFPYGHIIIGAENMTTDDIRYTAGFRLAARNW